MPSRRALQEARAAGERERFRRRAARLGNLRQRQQAVLEAQVAAVERVILRALRAALRDVSRRLRASAEAVITAAGEESFISVDDLAQIPSEWRRQLPQLVASLREAMREGAAHAAYEAGLIETVGDYVLPQIVSQTAELQLANAANRLVRVGDLAWEAAREQLLEGFQLGESIPQLAKRVQSSLDVVEARARVIARTETVGAVNGGALAEARQEGIRTKTWLATNDVRTRESHAEADGQTVSVDEAFTVGGWPAQFPGDPDLPPEEAVSCRCTLLWNVEEAEPLIEVET